MSGLGMALEIQRANRSIESKPQTQSVESKVEALGKMSSDDAKALAKAIMTKFAPVSEADAVDDDSEDLDLSSYDSVDEVEDRPHDSAPDIGAILGRVKSKPRP